MCRPFPGAGAGRSRAALGFSPLYAQAHRTQTSSHMLVRPVGQPAMRPRLVLDVDAVD